ncbi:MAG: nuclease domain-containing protein, partial [Thermomicrobiales bacterium]
QVEYRLRRLRSFLAGDSSETPAAELDALERELRAARSQASFLREVGHLGQVPTDVTMVLVKKPAYRKLLEAFLDFRRRSAVRLNEPALESPLENLPSLYETWGVLQAIQTILELGETSGYRLKRCELFRRGPVGSWIEVLPNGRPVLTLEHPSDGTKVSVIPQRTYSTVSSDLKSISYSQKPDLAVEVMKPRRQTEVYLLDPKYKLESDTSTDPPGDGKPKKVDIDKMHAYRDAIRDAQGRRVVKFAGILYPGPRQAFTPGLAALSAVPGEGAELADQLRQVFVPALA